MNVLVTGAAGFVGKHLVKRLKKDGYTVTALVRENTDTSFLDESGVKIVRADLREKASLYPAFEGIEAVVHLATTMKGQWNEYEESTINGTRRLLEIAKEKNVSRFIFLSSIAVYDVYSTQKEVTEDTLLNDENKASNYEKSKILAERVVGEFAQKGLATVILRSGVIYGPGGALFVPRLGFGFGSSRYLTVGDGKNRIPLVYVQSLVDAICLALVKDGIAGEVFTIVDDQNIDQNQYLQAVKESVVPSLKVSHVPLSFMSLIGACMTGLLGLLKRPSPIRSVYLHLCDRQIYYSNKKAGELLGWSSSK
ncbi:MAG: NAD-dependent epimerase/dehydratase family protein, partial [Candidatus Omnitrophica bacterium]|nr:NAD-dependent epimerase/dehydratase family protein [Candidatus Omnitrophota bacterium]